MKQLLWVTSHAILYVAWVVVFVSVIGSLVFSEVMQYVPCVLCWYQRICMYPLVVVLAVGIIRKENSVVSYVLPLSFIGLLISLYQNLLVWGILPESAAPCTLGVSCTTTYFAWFGFITIPFLSLLAFAFITLSMILFLKLKAQHK